RLRLPIRLRLRLRLRLPESGAARPAARGNAPMASVADQREAGIDPTAGPARQIEQVHQPLGLGQLGGCLAPDAGRAHEDDAVPRKSLLRAGPEPAERHVARTREVPAGPFVRLANVDDVELAVGDQLLGLSRIEWVNHVVQYNGQL